MGKSSASIRVKMSASLTSLIFAMLAGGELSAQVRVPDDTASPGRFALTGLVYDSIASRPLAGAVVQLVSVRQPERVTSLRADSTGRFRVEALEGGSFLLAATHPRLDSLLLRPIERALVIDSAESTQFVELATPSLETLGLMFCGASPEQHGTSLPPRGFMLGHLRRHDRLPLAHPAGGVRARWRQLDVNPVGLRTLVDSADARVDAPHAETSSAAFVLCGLPEGQPVTLQAWIGPDSTASLEVDAPSSGVLLRDLVVPIASEDSSRRRSTTGTSAEPKGVPLGRLSGFLRDSSGAGIANAEVLGVGFDQSARSDSTGAFTLREVPAGTQTLLVRALGFSPLRLLVNVMSEPAESIDLRMLRPPTTLSAMTIRERRSFAGFEARRHRGAGIYLDEQTIKRRQPQVVADLMKFQPGVRVLSSADDEPQFITRFGRKGCEPSVYVDGRLLPRRTKDLDAYVAVSRIRAVEIYSVPAEVPLEFSYDIFCGAVIIWTHQ